MVHTECAHSKNLGEDNMARRGAGKNSAGDLQKHFKKSPYAKYK